MPPSKRCTNPDCPEANPQPHDAFYVARIGAEGYPILRGHCKTCSRSAAKRWQTDNLNQAAKSKREWRARKRVEDPEWWDAWRAYQREWARRKGGYSERRLTCNQPSVELMAAPFGEWIASVMVRDDVPLSELALRWGISEGALRRAKNRGGTVEIATVEAALTADGTCLVSDLYDDQELAA